MNFRDIAEQNENWIIEQRRYFHAHPELSFEEKNTTHELSLIHIQMCIRDRYKILNGKRNPPSSEVFEKMTQFMHLTPIEYNFLKETLEITQVGPDTYYTRKSVENFICQFPDQPATDITGSSFSPDPVSEQCQTDCISLVSQQHIDYYVPVSYTHLKCFCNFLIHGYPPLCNVQLLHSPCLLVRKW